MSLNRAIRRDLGMPYRVIARCVKTRRVHAALTSTWVATSAVAADNIGPSTTTEPYIVPSHPLVKTKSILTVGDSVPLATDPAKSYRLLGIPDGLGAFQSEGKTFTLLVNHELGPTQGPSHTHGFPEYVYVGAKDEESSGIIEAEGILGKGWFLLDVQAHKAHPETALVEFGQVLAMFVDPRLGKEVK
ncbi:MAG TPA: hypothetical protein VE965_03800 [Gammaproteobacteria bacterium]|nr:hypothetical protein [Gammaproteobacteria bacterium]